VCPHGQDGGEGEWIGTDKEGEGKFCAGVFYGRSLVFWSTLVNTEYDSSGLIVVVRLYFWSFDNESV